MIKRHMARLLVFVIMFFSLQSLSAGVVNPDISALGSVLFTYQENLKHKFGLDLGEAEVQLDAALNPYAKGVFVLSLDKAGISIEEGYLSLIHGLPSGLSLKAGKYRLGFGKLNPAHPHAYPFITAPAVLAAFLPGDDGFNDVAIQASYMLPFKGTWASVISADLLRGSVFHPDDDFFDPAVLYRWSNSFLIADSVPFEIGLSDTHGRNDTGTGSVTRIYGADIKFKPRISPLAVLVLQSEFFGSAGTVTELVTDKVIKDNRTGFYIFADLNLSGFYNGGALYERFQSPANNGKFTQNVRIFAGWSLMEETTLFRLMYEYSMPPNSRPVNSCTLQVMFSMGPHKAHQY